MEDGRWEMEAKDKALRRRPRGFLKSVSPDFGKRNSLCVLRASVVKKQLKAF